MSGRRRIRFCGIPTAIAGGTDGIGCVSWTRSRNSPGRLAQQDRQGVLHLLQGQLERRDGRLGVVQQRLGLVEVQLAGHAALEFRSRDLNALGLEVDVLGGDFQPLLVRADHQVVLGHLGNEGHHRVVVFRDARIELRRGLLDHASELAPEIGLPANVEAQAVAGELVVEQREMVHRVVAESADSGGPADRLLLGIALAHGDRKTLLRLQDSQPGRAQRQVLGQRILDQLIEHGILERAAPPFRVDHGFAAQLRIVQVHPLGCHGRRGRLVLGADHRAARGQQDRRQSDAERADSDPACRSVHCSAAGAAGTFAASSAMTRTEQVVPTRSFISSGTSIR